MGRMMGARVALREFRWEDLPDIRAWVTDDESTRALGGAFVKPRTWEQTEMELKARLDGDSGGASFVIADRTSMAYLGQCDLMMIDSIARTAEVAMVLNAPYRHQGYGQEALHLLCAFAFDHMNLHRLWLHVYADNAAAIHCYEKIGFVREGCLRQARYREGRYEDIIVMGLLRDEYPKDGNKQCDELI